ncbi:MarR family transcriptional regulator [Pseudoalteromonas sp. SG44-5]|uniref:MarR family winged helix-turn-helix transcriptional regulator n=1 Tax=Pseudoalteromonas sp. SG44-5 TaxID=2760960 RepID=UPI0015FE5181|nr:MarR family transcriptional regulator [Pseudoalteromonas sp. SG44-5]MBB1404666.1 MarR family transcriptional regulator [Pseudoalteromonas sp. SG44-5]
MSSGDFSNQSVQNLGYLLKRAQQSLRTKIDSELRATEITLPQYAVLSTVAISPGISNADLAKAAFVTPQTMQGIISTLEKRNFLIRSKDPQHGRRLMTKLTNEGKTAMEAAQIEIIKVEKMMLNAIADRDIEFATQTLLKCIDNLTTEK